MATPVRLTRQYNDYWFEDCPSTGEYLPHSNQSDTFQSTHQCHWPVRRVKRKVFPQSVDVIISGPVPVLDALTSQDITVSVDCRELDVGVYQLEPKVNPFVENVLVESILPSTVEVVIALPQHFEPAKDTKQSSPEYMK